jgi:uncharacterized membrane protein YoaK (UPF0700 family)
MLMAAPETKATLPSMLCLSAGYVDTAGFLALRGLFTAHVTGNCIIISVVVRDSTQLQPSGIDHMSCPVTTI